MPLSNSSPVNSVNTELQPKDTPKSSEISQKDSYIDGKHEESKPSKLRSAFAKVGRFVANATGGVIGLGVAVGVGVAIIKFALAALAFAGVAGIAVTPVGWGIIAAGIALALIAAGLAAYSYYKDDSPPPNSQELENTSQSKQQITPNERLRTASTANRPEMGSDTAEGDCFLIVAFVVIMGIFS